MKFGISEELCSGCRVCELVCGLTVYGENNPRKAALKIVGHFPQPGRYEISYCDQCGECAKVCPEGAIKERNGVYRIDDKLCNGCGVCVPACPRGAMFTHPEETVPIKCIMCAACFQMCPRTAVYDADKPVAARRW